MIDTIGFLVFSREEEIRDQKIVFLILVLNLKTEQC